MTACASSEFPVPEPIAPQSFDALTMRIMFPEVTAVTKAIYVADESKIESLRIFVFTDAGTQGVTLDDVLDDVIVVHKDSIKNDVPPLRVIVPVKALPEQRFILVANMPSTLASGLNLQIGVTTETQLIEQLKFSAAAWRTDLTSANFTPFPMWGKTGFYTPTSLLTPIDVEMMRTLAKIEIGTDINNPAAGDPALGFGHIFTIDSVYVCNVNDSAYIAPSAGTIKTRKVDIGYRFPSDDLMLSRSIYVPETEALVLENNDTIHWPPYLVLKARYYNGNPYYYRIDFTNDNTYRPLLRNHSYTFNITGIRTVGYETLEKAKNAPSFSLNPNLILSGEQEMTRKINDIVYSDTYWLGCEATDIKVDWNVKSATITVGSSYPGGWSVEKVSSSSADFAYVKTGNDALTIGYTGLNDTGQPRTARLKLTAGALTQYINITQSPGSHTYVAKQSSGITIPLTSADIDGLAAERFMNIKYITYYFAPFVSNEATFVSRPVAASTNAITIPESGTLSKTGNMIVTAYDGDPANGGNVLWTWTVWVVDDAVDFDDPQYQRYYNGYTFMDRNLLGNAVDAAGVCYQWGRMDPALDTIRVYVPPVVNLAEVAKFPRSFYLSNTAPYNWLDTQSNNLWITIDGEKGIYDPCPFGWRVPPAENDEASPWKGFKNGDNNMTIAKGTGYSGKDGVWLTDKYLWGASARGTDAYYYDCANGVHGRAPRTYAYPIRCIRDVKRAGATLIIKSPETK
jgi:hypothetical protein